jgi:hypothetical protein
MVRVRGARDHTRSALPRLTIPQHTTPHQQLLHQRLRAPGLAASPASRPSSSLAPLRVAAADNADAAATPPTAAATTTRRASLLALGGTFALPGVSLLSAAKPALAAAQGKGAAVGAARVGARYVHTEEEWRRILAQGVGELGPVAGGKGGEPGADFRYKVLRTAYTELPLSSGLYKESRKGTYVCAGCGSDVYRSDAKYNSGEEEEEERRGGGGGRGG